ncbi:uncharacterized protein LOC111101405 [Crassostrea virginica]
MTQLSDKEKEAFEIRRSFDALGVNGDGKVSVSEVLKGTLYPGFNPASKEATDMIKELDPKGSGLVDFGQYEMFMKTVIKKIEYEKNLFMKAFRKFDKNGDGSVSYEELKEVFLARGKSEKDVQDFFNEADLNKDGRVDYEEFVKWFSKT